MLPENVTIEPIYDRTWLIDTTLHTVFKNLLEGATLVTGVLLVFLGSLRAALIVALMIPLSLLATFTGLTLRGIPANLLSLGAMDFGIIVDGAVIVVENIFRKLAEHSTHQRGFKRDLRSLKQVILAATTPIAAKSSATAGKQRTGRRSKLRRLDADRNWRAATRATTHPPGTAGPKNR